MRSRNPAKYSLRSFLVVAVMAACGDETSTSGTGASGAGGSPTSGGSGGIGGVGANGGVGGALDGGGGNTTTDGGGGAPPDPCEGVATVSFAADVVPLLEQSCTFSACHAGPMPDAGLDLTAANALAELIGVNSQQCGASSKRVVPGDPDASYLFDKLLGIEMCGMTSVKMPRNPPMGQSAPPWTDANTEVFRAWICGGALDD